MLSFSKGAYMQDKKIFIKGKDRTADVLKCIYAKNVYYVTFKDGKRYPYKYCDIEIVKVDKLQTEINEKFKYFRDLASQIGLIVKNEKGQSINILEKNYKTIDEIKKDSILFNYLNQELPLTPVVKKDTFGSFFKLINSKNDKLEDTLIYPFGFNISQDQAVDKAIKNKLSVIEGPPGTGKTQTILNIIANAIMHNESIAVVSSNNSATKNIIDKLKKSNVDFIAAYLGNNQNKQDFIDSQILDLNTSVWELTEKEIKELYLDIKQRYKALKNMLVKQNELSVLKQKLSALEIEEKHYLNYLSAYQTLETPKEIAKIADWKKAIQLSILFEITADEIKSNYFIELLKCILEFLKIKKFNKTIAEELLKKYPKDYLVAITQQKFYEIQIKELKDEINVLNSELESYNFSQKMKDYSELSAKIFKSKLAEKYAKQKRKIWMLPELQWKSKEFIKDYPVILSTTYSLRNSLSSDVMYDYVIVDEASQVDLCTGALALSCAKKAVIVGDLKQLPNVVDSKNATISDSIFNNYKLPEMLRYKNHCLLSSITEMFPDAPHTLLKEHYRCHPMIIEFCNKKFYNNELIILSDIKTDRKPLLVYKTIAGNLAYNNINQRQIDVIKEEIIPNEKLNINNDSLGIVTPYRNQTNALQQQFKGTGVKADTVDKFQGQENKVIILSTVDNIIRDFTDNPNRLNVAISRAIEQLIVVINGNEAQKDNNIADLVKYIEYNNCEVKESKLFSIFDYLYECYAEQRRLFLQKSKKISEYDSENLFYKVLKEVLTEKYENRYGIAVRIPINRIIRDFSLLDKNELKYAQNDWTHVDFLIYSKINKSPIFAIEVDGVSYHSQDKKQFQRDIMKNAIFEKYKIPLIRFGTKEYLSKDVLFEKFKNYIA